MYITALHSFSKRIYIKDLLVTILATFHRQSNSHQNNIPLIKIQNDDILILITDFYSCLCIIIIQ